MKARNSNPKNQGPDRLKCSRTFTIVDRSVKDFTPAKGKPSWPFNKLGQKLLKLPSEPDQAKNSLER